MLDTRERKLERLNSGLMDSISTQTYNLIIGGLILYGFILNAIIIAFCGDMFASMDYEILLFGYFVCCVIGVLITRSDSPITSFIGYNLIVVPIGAVLSVLLPYYNSQDILSAIAVTSAVVAIMTTIAITAPQFFTKLGPTLFVTLLIAIVAELAATFVGYGGGIFNWLFIVIFTLYVGYDWHKAQMYPKTLDNAIDSSLEIYLDIINLFVRLLSIFSRDDD